MAADVHRGLAPGTGLLLRSEAPWSRLAGDFEEVSPAGGTYHGPRGAKRCDSTNGKRVVRAAYFRSPGRPSPGRRENRARLFGRGPDQGREKGRVSRGEDLSRRS